MRWTMLGMVLSGLLATGEVFAQPGPTDEQRAAARSLGDEGNALWDRGDYEGALDRFTRAMQLVDAPTLTLRQAECLEKLGRWVQAAERLLALGRTQVGQDAPAAFRTAVEKAWERGQALRERIPKLVIVVEGEGLERAELTVDGKRVERALWGVGQPMDPGDREVLSTATTNRVMSGVSA